MRTAAVLAITLGAVALVLVAIGLHGIMSYLVRRRTRELGMRMALGAPPNSLIWMVTLQGLRWTVSGAVLGIVGRSRVVDHRDAADRSRDCDGEQRHDEKLLAPFAPEHAPRPADHGAARGDAAVSRSGQR